MDNWKLNNKTVAVPKRMRASNGGSSRYGVTTALVSNRFTINLCPTLNDRTEKLCLISRNGRISSDVVEGLCH